MEGMLGTDGWGVSTRALFENDIKGVQNNAVLEGARVVAEGETREAAVDSRSTQKKVGGVGTMGEGMKTTTGLGFRAAVQASVGTLWRGQIVKSTNPGLWFVLLGMTRRVDQFWTHGGSPGQRLGRTGEGEGGPHRRYMMGVLSRELGGCPPPAKGDAMNAASAGRPW